MLCYKKIMMKNSKLKVSEYMENITRSKSFGKFVLIVYVCCIDQDSFFQYNICLFKFKWSLWKKNPHPISLSFNLSGLGKLSILLLWITALLTQIYWPKFKQTFKSTLNCIMTTVIGKHFTVLMFMHIFVKKWRGLKDFFQIPF